MFFIYHELSIAIGSNKYGKLISISVYCLTKPFEHNFFQEVFQSISHNPSFVNWAYEGERMLKIIESPH